jgi:hypothetical protein
MVDHRRLQQTIEHELHTPQGIVPDRAIPGGALFLIAFSILFMNPVQAALLPTCSGASWNGDPEMRDGHFVASVKVRCRLGQGALALLQENILSQLQRDKTQGTQPANDRSSFTYDVTHEVWEDEGTGEPLLIREEVLLDRNPTETLLYETRSKSIQATGMAGYLRNSDVKIRVERDSETEEPGFFRMEIQQTLRIERPWYALTPVFFVMAKNSVLSRFEKAALSIARDYHQKLSSRPSDPKPILQGNSP